MSEHSKFLERPEVRSALDDLVNDRMRLTEQGRADADLPAADEHLRARGISIPEGSTVRILRTVHETEEDQLSPMCNGERARPMHCRWIDKNWVCDWVCP